MTGDTEVSAPHMWIVWGFLGKSMFEASLGHVMVVAPCETSVLNEPVARTKMDDAPLLLYKKEAKI